MPTRTNPEAFLTSAGASAGTTASLRECVDACLNCQTVCLETFTREMRLGRVGGHTAALLDCAEICQISAALLLRGSELQAHVRNLCAEACDHCARACDAVDGGDEALAECAELCRRCAETCRPGIHGS
jgi:hypothetical protein